MGYTAFIRADNYVQTKNFTILNRKIYKKPHTVKMQCVAFCVKIFFTFFYGGGQKPPDKFPKSQDKYIVL